MDRLYYVVYRGGKPEQTGSLVAALPSGTPLGKTAIAGLHEKIRLERKLSSAVIVNIVELEQEE